HEHLVAIKALKGGLVLCILRYPYELREPKTYFEDINTKPEPEAVKLAKELIESGSLASFRLKVSTEPSRISRRRPSSMKRNTQERVLNWETCRYSPPPSA